MTRLVAAVLAVAAVIAGSATASPAVTAMPALYKNCTSLNKKYPHGLGKVGARDRTSGTPVTNFARSTRLYNVARSYNRGLDRDRDGIACEKA
jgi:hypothetical protein